MKTAKKLFSLLLVAVLLFSALPFQAAATTENNTQPDPLHQIIYRFYLADGTAKGDYTVTATKSGSLWTAAAPAVPSGYTLVKWHFRDTTEAITPANGYAEAQFRNTNESGTRYDVVMGLIEPVHTCSFTTEVSTTAADCENEGIKTLKCSCGKTTTEVVEAAKGHDLKTTTIPATDTAAGSTIVECQRAGCTYKTTTGIDQLGTEVQFVDIEGGRATQTRSWQKGASISSSNIPTLNDLNGRKFIGWYTQNAGGGYQFNGGIWNPGNENYATTYYARYQDSLYSNYASITVYANVYNGTRQVAQVKLSNEIPFTVGEYILDDLMDRREHFINTFFNISGYSAADYEVADQAFYMNTTDAKITDGTTLAKGNTSVYIKIKAKGSAAAPVQLFVHTKVESGYVAHYDVPGFIAGETITLTYIKNFLQSKTGKTYNITAMHDQHDWDRMLAGFTCESNTVLEVAQNGLRIHIVAPSYTSSSSTTSKPASNPATGDNSMLEITAATMLLAAAAVVTLTQLRKRKMI